ncbi:MAG: tRNA (adenosine(37)-N6)-threonylcarbamoyltransferase complex ATPase subunit type 1 TsaE [Bacteroidota bacterium]
MSLSSTFTLEEIDAIAQEVLKVVDGNILCFSGEMGAGKTTLIKALVKHLGGEDTGNSPTFGLVNQYNYPSGKILGYHFDFYRIENEEEVFDMGFEEYLNSEHWLFIEWPQLVEAFLPASVARITLHFIDKKTRAIEINSD